MNKKLFILGMIFLLLGIILCVFKIYYGILFAICSYFIVYFSFSNTTAVKKNYNKIIVGEDDEYDEYIEIAKEKKEETKKVEEKKEEKVIVKKVIKEEKKPIVKENIKTFRINKEAKKDDKEETKEIKETKEKKEKSIRTYSVNNEVIKDSNKIGTRDLILSLEDAIERPGLSIDEDIEKSNETYEKYVQVRFLGYSKIYTYISNPLKKLNTGDYVTVISNNGEEKIVYVVEGDKILPKKYDMEYKMIQFPMYIFNNNNYQANYNYNNMVK